ncbi:glycosyltransferase [Paenibacillus harenae]|uniref:GT2 family glycosyltransferase n=1 Tax=Paenibacillus harenae TaxID=306543 RepID=A0ABT9U9W9_PAEHA|nr:glycosyltransferase [Paenibacillus harenae]MDQ0115229.1 GT2 family glycosyltransferase [Paenibacillus harenae]
MFNRKLSHALSIMRKKGIRSLLYKVYKKGMVEFYVRTQNLRVNDSHNDTSVTIRIVPPSEIIPRVNLHSRISILILFDGEEERLAAYMTTLRDQLNGDYDYTIVSSLDRNGGWARTVNNVAKEAEGEYLLLLNAVDVVPKYGWVAALLNCFQSSEVGAAGLWSASGEVGNDASRWTEAVKPCLMIEKESFLACDGFSEAYRGDIALPDFCMRLSAVGKSIQFIADPTISPMATYRHSSADEVLDFALYVNRWGKRQATNLQVEAFRQ